MKKQKDMKMQPVQHTITADSTPIQIKVIIDQAKGGHYMNFPAGHSGKLREIKKLGNTCEFQIETYNGIVKSEYVKL